MSSFGVNNLAPTSMPSPGYFIYRDAQSEAFDPTAPLQFFPPKDSDDLFFALKVAYPALSTHAERMRNAVIDFLLHERDAEQLKSQSPAYLVNSAPSYNGSSMSSNLTDSSSSSMMSTPNLVDNLSPPRGSSPSGTAPSLSRSSSQAQSTSSARPIEQMTSVFSLSSQTQPRQRVRRKMTEAEKVDYRKRRQVRACDKCSKRKRKCHHNQSDLKTTTRVQRIAQQSDTENSSKSAGKRPEAGSAVETSASPNDLTSVITGDMMNLSSFDMLDDSLEDFIDFDAMPQMQFDHFPWSTTPDWTLLDDRSARLSPQAQQQPLLYTDEYSAAPYTAGHVAHGLVSSQPILQEGLSHTPSNASGLVSATFAGLHQDPLPAHHAQAHSQLGLGLGLHSGLQTTGLYGSRAAENTDTLPGSNAASRGISPSAASAAQAQTLLGSHTQATGISLNSHIRPLGVAGQTTVLPSSARPSKGAATQAPVLPSPAGLPTGAAAQAQVLRSSSARPSGVLLDGPTLPSAGMLPLGLAAAQPQNVALHRPSSSFADLSGKDAVRERRLPASTYAAYATSMLVRQMLCCIAQAQQTALSAAAQSWSPRTGTCHAGRKSPTGYTSAIPLASAMPLLIAV